MWRDTLDHSDGFYTALKGVTIELHCDILNLLGAANAESGVSAKAANPHSSATGLLQWMSSHYEDAWGYSRAEFAALTAEEQVPYVRRYLMPHKNLLSSCAAIYVAIFLPAFVRQAKDPEFVLCARAGNLPWAYAANAVFDRDGDGRITVGELEAAIKRNWAGPRCEEMLARAGTGRRPDWEVDTMDTPEDIRTTLGLQRKLIRLGYNLGPSKADGVPGAFTRRALMSFQRRMHLDADGIMGPKTYSALVDA